MFCQAVVFRGAAWYNKHSMQHTNASKTSRLPSLVETISQGFAAVHRCLWVLLIPLLLDLCYWLGPRISVQPLVDRLLALVKALDPQRWEAFRQQTDGQLTTTTALLDFWQDGLVQMPNVNLLKPLNLVTPLIVAPPPPITPTVWSISSLAVLLGAWLLINIIGLVATSVYLLPLADVVRGVDVRRISFARFVRALGSLASIVGLYILAALVGGIPLLLAASIAAVISPALGGIISIFALALLIWLLFTASFSFDAVVVSGVGPLRALLTSLFLVQRSFWSTMGLLILGWMILAGMAIIWQVLSTTTWGLIVAMVGGAYISTGLAAAHLIFYRDRLSRITKPI